MARTAAKLNHEQVTRLVTVLTYVSGQPARDPISTIEIAGKMDVKPASLTPDIGLAQRRGWAERREAKGKKGVFLKVTNKGKAALKSYATLYG